jgi:hypothetical protein
MNVLGDRLVFWGCALELSKVEGLRALLAIGFLYFLALPAFFRAPPRQGRATGWSSSGLPHSTPLRVRMR